MASVTLMREPWEEERERKRRGGERQGRREREGGERERM